MTVLEANPFDRILIASVVELAVRDLLTKWFPTYLREVERQVNWDRQPLDAPNHYTNRTSFDIVPGEALPKAVVISPGLYEAPTHPQGSGNYNASWQVAVGIATAGNSEELADFKCKMYGGAARAIMAQHQSLDSDIGATQVRWIDESYDDLNIPDQLMTYRGAAILFAIDVEDVVSRWAGPLEPDEQTQLDSTADTVDVDVEVVDELP